LGQTLRQKGDLEGAVQAFEKALKLKPELQEAYYNLGLTLKQAAASPRFRRSPRGHPVSAQAEDHYKQGVELLARGDSRGAKGELVKAVQLDSEYAEAHNLLNFVLGQLGESREH
jgi:Flp pilus assembly protein TadD